MGVNKELFFLALLVVLIFSFAGCEGKDWRQHNGYVISTDYGERHFVSHKDPTGYGGDVIVGPKITHWNTYNEYLLVYKVPNPKKDLDFPWANETGYVIINTSDGGTTFSKMRKNYEDMAVKHLGIPQAETVLHSIYHSIKTIR